jgi:hypothetical protein
LIVSGRHDAVPLRPLLHAPEAGEHEHEHEHERGRGFEQARHPDMAMGRVGCLSVKVQKCQYCAQSGESMTSIAADFNTDWLHLYTTNPTVLDPDNLPSGQVLNTGVLYDVREGDYLELLADRFFSSVQMLLAVNPDVGPNTQLLEGYELCILPPVCGVECTHGLDCHPIP